jgi:hypothetical protein
MDRTNPDRSGVHADVTALRGHQTRFS